MIKTALHSTLKEIRKLEADYDRVKQSVNLLAVSKTFPKDAVIDAYNAGQRHFGENYLQDALNKISTITLPDIKWHFIGNIQSNKCKDIAENFDWVHTVDREKIANKLNQYRTSAKFPLNCCIQVNVSKDSNKSGLIDMESIKQLAKTIEALPHLKLAGLMTVPTFYPTFEQQKVEFDKLTTMFNKLKSEFPDIDTLSMGMTQDINAAIAAGSTWVRIGTGIFGKR